MLKITTPMTLRERKNNVHCQCWEQKVKKFLVFPTCVKLGVWSGSGSGSASKWKVGSVADQDALVRTVPIHNTGIKSCIYCSFRRLGSISTWKCCCQAFWSGGWTSKDRRVRNMASSAANEGDRSHEKVIVKLIFCPFIFKYKISGNQRGFMTWSCLMWPRLPMVS